MSTTTLSALATEITREHEAARAAATSALQHARRAGELLLEAKEQVGHGGWTDWLNVNFPASARTARLYMQVARRWGDVAPGENGNALPIREAARLLAEPTERSELQKLEDQIEALVPDMMFSSKDITIGRAGPWELWIEPAEQTGYFHATTMRRSDADTIKATGTIKPVSPFGIALHVAFEEGFPLTDLIWEMVPFSNKIMYNRWLFTSHDDYMRRHVLDPGGGVSEFNRKMREGLIS